MKDSEFVGLIEKHRHEFYRYVRRNVWNPSVADDVFSSAVLAAFKQLSKFREGSNFRAWVFKILTNKCFVANRETKRSAVDIETVQDEFISAFDHQRVRQQVYAEPECFLQECGDEVHEALRQLSTAQRSCLLLLAFEKYSYKEIASILEIPIGTVMTHLSRGRKKLKKTLLTYAVHEGIVTINENEENTEITEQRSAG